MSTLLKKHWLKFAAMIIIVGIFVKWTNLSASLSSLCSIDLVFFGMALILVLGFNLLKGIRFCMLLQASGIRLSFLHTFLVSEMTLIVGRITPAKLGEGIKVMYIDAKKTDLSFCFVLERLADFISLFFFALFSLSLFSQFMPSVVLFGAGIIAVIAAMMYSDRLLKFFFKQNVLEEKWFINGLKKLSISDWATYISLSICIRLGVLVLPVLIGRSLGIHLDIITTFALYSVAILVGNLSALPGGFGAREGTYSYLLSQAAAISMPLAGLAATLITLSDLLIETALGITAYLLLKLFSARSGDKISQKSKK